MKLKYILGFAVVLVLIAGIYTARSLIISQKSQFYHMEDKIGMIELNGMKKSEREATVDYVVDKMLILEKDMTIPMSYMENKEEIPLSRFGFMYDIENAAWRMDGSWQINKPTVVPLNVVEQEKDESTLRSLLNTLWHVQDVKPKDAYLEFDDRGTPFIIEHQTGTTINIAKLRSVIYSIAIDLINGRETDKIVVLEEYISVTQPYITNAVIKECTSLLGGAITNYDPSQHMSNRNGNIELSSDMIKGTVVYPGGIFSVYGVTSPYTVENGYAMAGVLTDGLANEAVGGGVCQVTTTLYNAVIRAELTVLQRFNHTLRSTYVAPAFDATVSSEEVDFKFINDTKYPIFIYMNANNGVVSAMIYGKESRPSGRTLRFNSVYDAVKDVFRLEKSVYIDNQLEEIEVVNESRYKTPG